MTTELLVIAKNQNASNFIVNAMPIIYNVTCFVNVLIVRILPQMLFKEIQLLRIL